jgi:hypothetical protein
MGVNIVCAKGFVDFWRIGNDKLQGHFCANLLTVAGEYGDAWAVGIFGCIFPCQCLGFDIEAHGFTYRRQDGVGTRFKGLFLDATKPREHDQILTVAHKPKRI